MAAAELLLAPRKQFHQRRTVQSIAHVEVSERRHLRVLVPRTYELAIVAAINAVADRTAQFLRNRALVLDGQIRNTAPRVELIRRGDRVSRAHIDAAPACPAVVTHG